MGKNRANIQEKILIYYSHSDKCWIAHSLSTDQIGVGDCIVEALMSLIKAVCFVVEDGFKDNTLKILRDAPKDIQQKISKAEKLPQEVYDIAFKMVHGEWPQDIEPDFRADDRNPYITETETFDKTRMSVL